jgi:hypothetical protein
VDSPNRLSGLSLYSQVTVVPNGPELRQPVKKDLLTSRFSASSLNSSVHSGGSMTRDLTGRRSPVELYTMSVRSDLLVDTSTGNEPSHPTGQWIGPNHTRVTVLSKNPFRNFFFFLTT